MLKYLRIAAALVLLTSSLAFAQGGRATLTGAVTDKTGARIPGATVVLTDAASSAKRTSIADSSGIISFIGVPASTYAVDVSAPGFKTLRQTGIEVHINDQLDLHNLSLAVAASDNSVTVTTEANSITPTTSGEQSYTLTDKQIQNLNIESRSAIELLDLIPGAANTGNFTGTYNRQQAGFGNNASTYTVNGNRFDQVQIVSDGAPVTDLNTAGAASVTPNVDMISEAKVETSAFSATQPNGPIVFNTQTKSGGHDYHGEAYLTVRNHIFDANDSYNKQLGLAKPNSSYYYPGFNIGGPVLIPGTNFNRSRDKLFFFAATEITQQHVDLGPQTAIVPTAAMRTGDFSNTKYNSALASYATNMNPCSGYSPGYPYVNRSTTYCKGNTTGILDPTMIDPGGRILLNAIPLPNADPATHNGYNLVTDFITSDPRNQENFKVDYNPTEKLHLSGRFNHENENVPAPYGPYNTVGYNKVPYPANQVGRNASNSFNADITYAITPSLTNELTVSYTRYNGRIDIGPAPSISRSATAYPYPNLYPSTSDLLPNVSFDQTNGGLYINGGENPPLSSIQNTTTISNGLTKLLGKHLLQFGFYDVLASFNNRTTGNDNGTISLGTYINYSSGNEFADLLLGNIAGFAQSSKNVNANMANKRYDFYAADTWKATSRLTLNYGARLDHIAWWYDKNGLISTFNPALYDKNAPYNAYTGFQDHATNAAIPLSGSKPLGFQIAPSIGFAHDVFGRGETIFRGGFGTNYYVDPGINSFSAIGAPPNLQQFSNYQSYQYTLKNAAQTDLTTTAQPVYGSAVANDHQPAVTYSWNLAVAQILPRDIHFEISYVGNTTRHLNGYSVTNIVPLGSETGPYFGTFYSQKARPYQAYQDIGIHLHNLNSNYNSLQVTASKSRGPINTYLTYTYGKALAFNCEDPFNERNCYGPAPFDRSQQINFSYFITLPKPSEKYLGNHLVGNVLLDGWQISGIEQYGVGSPFSVIAQNGALHNEYGGNQIIGIYGNNGLNLTNDAITGTPDEATVPVVVCNPGTNLKPHQYYNPSCFAAPSQGQNGTFRIPYVHGPSYFNDEIGFFKDIRIRDAGRLQIRFQGFNFLNRAQDTYQQYDSRLYMGFSATGKAPDNAQVAGVTTVRQGHRTLQAALKYYF